ncbi:MAG: DNA repair protein RecO C-terminal domain-containing protein [Bacteroidaceae bacterium]|nr:DNA repair protein RecO C-terminal domain-containing protein [Bacteroidaceae bacterium]
MLQRAKGIVLHTLKYKDNQLIAVLYTSQWGRMSFITSIPKTRKSGAKHLLLQPLAEVELEADIKPHATLFRVRSLQPVQPFASIPYDPIKSVITLFLQEFLYRAVREEGQPNEAFYTYLSHSVRWLDMAERDYANFHLVFLLRVSRFLGLQPNIEHYFPGCYFDMLNAMFVPAQPQAHSFYVAPPESSYLVNLMRLNYSNMYLFKMNRQERQRLLSLINDYYRLHLPDFPELNSLSILKEVFD